MQIIPVDNAKRLKQFVNLPYTLYANDPNWIAPLRSEQMAQYDARKNPMLNHCTYALFLLEDQGRVIGRISAFLDHLALAHWGQPIGLFGSFECIEDPQAAQMLLETAQHWLQAKGMQSMRGPWSFASQEWGLVLEGFTPPARDFGTLQPALVQ